MSALFLDIQPGDEVAVEDNAHGLFGKYKGKYLGTFGSMSTLSFHETKNFTCGEISDRLLRIPFYNSLSKEDLAAVVHAIRQFQE
jgi:dTDP-4-amino-4,6-dideoxygalactose transaminase